MHSITAAPVTTRAPARRPRTRAPRRPCMPLAMRIAAPAPACVAAPAGAIGSAADAAEAQTKRERERERAVERERVQQQEDRRAAQRPGDGDEEPGGARLLRAMRMLGEPAAEAEAHHALPPASFGRKATTSAARTPATATTRKPARTSHRARLTRGDRRERRERCVVEHAEHDQAEPDGAEARARAREALDASRCEPRRRPGREARCRRRTPRRRRRRAHRRRALVLREQPLPAPRLEGVGDEEEDRGGADEHRIRVVERPAGVHEVPAR